MAPTNMKLAGKVTRPCARLMVTTLSSSGWRNTSSSEWPNSGSSSRKSTPRWLRLISPGLGQCPFYMLLSLDICQVGNGRDRLIKSKVGFISLVFCNGDFTLKIADQLRQ